MFTTWPRESGPGTLYYSVMASSVSLRNCYVEADSGCKKFAASRPARSSERARSALEAAGAGWLDAGGCPATSAVVSLVVGDGALVTAGTAFSNRFFFW